MNLAAVAGLPSRPIVGVWYRAIDPQHLRAALGYSHTRWCPGRYCEGPAAAAPFDIVYLAENPMVAQFEVGALFGSPLTAGGVTANPARSWVTINAQVQLMRVVDLTDVHGAHLPLSTSAQELTGDWRGYRDRNAGASVSAPVGSAPHKNLAQPSTREDCWKDFSPYPPDRHGNWFSAFSLVAWAMAALSATATWILTEVCRYSRSPDQTGDVCDARHIRKSAEQSS
jgi:hypothetical protein